METVTLIRDYAIMHTQHIAEKPYGKSQQHMLYSAGHSITGNWNLTKTHFMIDGLHDQAIPADNIVPDSIIDLHSIMYQFRPKTVQESEQIQQILFDEGFKWDSSGTTVSHRDKPVLLTWYSDMSICHSDSTENRSEPELTLQDLQRYKGINMPTLDLDYFNSNKCAILIDSYEEVAELHQAGIDFATTLLNVDAFSLELKTFQPTIAWIDRHQWGHLSDYADLPHHTAQEVINSLKGRPMENLVQGIQTYGQLDQLKLDVTDMSQFLRTGDRIFVVNTFKEALKLKALTGVALPNPLTTPENFDVAIAAYKTDLAFHNDLGWNNSDYYKSISPFESYIQLDIHDVEYLLKDQAVFLDTVKPIATAPVIEQELWKNPKPSKKNTQPMKQGDYYVTEGCAIPLIAPVDSVEIPIDGYPLHKLLSEQKPKIGDITEIDSQWTVIKSKADINQIKTLQKDSATTVYLWRITDENNKAIKVMNLNRYSCGTILDNDTNKVLPVIPPGVKIDTDYSYDFTWEHKQISKHFDVDIESLQTQDEVLHKQLSTTLDHELNVARKEWAYIWGPSGSGKSTLAVDYANTVGRAYILQQGTAQLTVDDLLGYKSITTGKYFSSLLRDAVENGKVFILDEADACNANSVLCLNALKHDTFQFPDKLVDIHPDFRLIMTANTCNDYSDDYSSRNPLDKATLDRCAIIEYNMKDYHLALRYGLEHVKQITNLENKSPRQVEREITNMKINPPKTVSQDVIEDNKTHIPF